MSTTIKRSAMAVAATAAGLLLAGCASSGAQEMASSADSTVKCAGVNSCKGQTACKSASNSCKGQNSCKGEGWLKMDKGDCEAKGGKII